MLTDLGRHQSYVEKFLNASKPFSSKLVAFRDDFSMAHENQHLRSNSHQSSDGFNNNNNNNISDSTPSSSLTNASMCVDTHHETNQQQQPPPPQQQQHYKMSNSGTSSGGHSTHQRFLNAKRMNHREDELCIYDHSQVIWSHGNMIHKKFDFSQVNNAHSSSSLSSSLSSLSSYALLTSSSSSSSSSLSYPTHSASNSDGNHHHHYYPIMDHDVATTTLATTHTTAAAVTGNTVLSVCFCDFYGVSQDYILSNSYHNHNKDDDMDNNTDNNTNINRNRSVNDDENDNKQEQQDFMDSSGDDHSIHCSYHSCLCVLLDDQLLQIYTPDGKSFRVPLPCRMKRMWTLNGKLLILERDVSHVSLLTRSTTERVHQEQRDELGEDHHESVQQHPILFSLIHPLEELKPVAVLTDALIKDLVFQSNRLSVANDIVKMNVDEERNDEMMNDTDGDDMCEAEFFDDPNLEVLFVNEEDTYPIIVVYDHKRHTHFIYNAHIETATYNQHSDLDYYGEGYEEDEDSDRLDSEVFFRPINFTSVHGTNDTGLNGPRADSIIMCDGFEGQALLVLLKKKEKRAYVYKMNPTISSNDGEEKDRSSFLVTLWEMSFLCTHDNITAAAKIDSEGVIFNDHESNQLSSRESLLMLLLNETKQLVIVYAGEHRLCELSLPLIQSNIIDVVDVVHNRLTVVMSDQTKHRILVRVTCDSELTSKCFAVLRRTLSPALFSSLFYDFYQYKQTHQGLSEWEIFSNFLCGLFLKAGHSAYQQRQERSADSWTLLMSHVDHFPTDIMFDHVPVQESVSLCPSTEFTTSLDVFLHNVPLVVLSLHLLYESTKIDSLDSNRLSKPMAALLYRLCRMIGRDNYCDFYLRDYPALANIIIFESINLPKNIEGTVAIQAMETIDFFDATIDNNIVILFLKGDIVPNVHKTLSEFLLPPDSNYPVVAHPIIKDCPITQWTRRTCRLFHLLHNTSDIYQSCYPSNVAKLTNASERLVVAMVEEGISSLDDLDELPFGIALPMIQSIQHCKSNHSFSSLDLSTFEKVNRLLGREDLLQLANNSKNQLNEDDQSPFSSSSTATDDIYYDFSGAENNSSYSTPSSKSVVLEQQMHISKKGLGYFVFHHDKRLLEVYHMLDSSAPMKVKKEILGLSDDDLDRFDPNSFEQQHLFIKLRQRVLALSIGRGMVTLATKNTQPTDSVKIPPIATTGILKRNRANVVLDLLPADLSDTYKWAEFHNGVATGLTLQRLDGRDHSKRGITREWIMYHRPKKPTPSHAGLLLALGIQGHLAVLAPTDIYNYLFLRHESTTIALLLGLSASKKGSQDVAVTKALSLHIPSLVSSSRVDMPAEVQCAALVGIGLLYCQSSHRFMSDVLLSELSRLPNDSSSNCIEGYALAAGFGLGFVCLAQGTKTSPPPGLSDLNINERLIRYMSGGARPDSDLANQRNVNTNRRSEGFNRAFSSSSKIQESNRYVNVDVAGPGACIALSLIYLRSHNELIAKELMIPTTRYQLDYIRPQMAFLRTVGHNIVMWDRIKNDEEWFLNQVPSVILESVFPSIHNISEIDDHLSSLYAYILAGCCFTLGLRFAGSHDQKVYSIIFSILKEFESGKLKKMNKTANTMSLPLVLNKHISENCLIMCSLALGCVMSGSGDIEAVRTLRRIRKKFTAQSSNVSANISTNRDEKVYGLHMGVSMALGLIFLGGGRCSLSTKPIATALLLCSLYLHLPVSPTDNQYHLQAFRHLYALAAEPRLIEARDVDNGQLCFLPLTLQMTDGSTQQKRAPCLIPELETLQYISITSERYYPLTLNMKSNSGALRISATSNNILLYVKKKTSYTSHSEDGTSNTHTPQLKYRMNNGPEEHESILMDTLSAILTQDVSELQVSRSASMILDSVYMDSPSIIYLRQSIDYAICQLSSLGAQHTTSKSQILWNIKLVLTFYNHATQGDGTTCLLSPDYLGQLLLATTSCLPDIATTIKEYLNGSKPSHLTGCVLEWSGMPSRFIVKQIATELHQKNHQTSVALWCDLLGPSLHHESAHAIHQCTL